MARLSREFYDGDTVEIAKKLLGKVVVRRLLAGGDGVPCPPETGPDRAAGGVSQTAGNTSDVLTDAPGILLAGRITETEAYIGRCDKACHAYNYRRTPRTDTLFMAPGHAYVYFIYGMYHCLNFVTEPEGEPAAVLIRGIEPIAGEALMARFRYGDKPLTPARMRNLSNGPGKVCQALFLTRAENRMDLTGDTLFVCDSPSNVGLPDLSPVREVIRCGPRIGVDYAEEARDFPWRFWLEREK